MGSGEEVVKGGDVGGSVEVRRVDVDSHDRAGDSCCSADDSGREGPLELCRAAEAERGSVEVAVASAHRAQIGKPVVGLGEDLA